MDKETDLCPGQIWKFNDETELYGHKNTYCIILSMEHEFGKDHWNVGDFWWSDKIDECGGARPVKLLEEEIRKNARFIMHFKDSLNLSIKNAKLIEALKFYANKDSWSMRPDGARLVQYSHYDAMAVTDLDKGDRAREALKENNE